MPSPGAKLGEKPGRFRLGTHHLGRDEFHGGIREQGQHHQRAQRAADPNGDRRLIGVSHHVAILGAFARRDEQRIDAGEHSIEVGLVEGPGSIQRLGRYRLHPPGWLELSESVDLTVIIGDQDYRSEVILAEAISDLGDLAHIRLSAVVGQSEILFL